MPFPLHKVPTGFLSLIRGRTLGRNPSEFSDMAIGTIDMHEFFASDILIGTSSAPTVGALANLFETFQLTTALALKSIGAELTIGAAAPTNVFMQWGIQLPAGGVNCWLGSLACPAPLVGQIIAGGSVLPNWVVPAGTLIVAQASATAAGVDHSLAVRVCAENYSLSG